METVSFVCEREGTAPFCSSSSSSDGTVEKFMAKEEIRG